MMSSVVAPAAAPPRAGAAGPATGRWVACLEPVRPGVSGKDATLTGFGPAEAVAYCAGV